MDDPSAVAAARRAGSELAAVAGLDEQDAGLLLIAISEIASNLVKHAVAGDLLLRLAPVSGHDCIEMIASDSGPGIPDLASALRDGTSTRGTLGVGMGAIARLASSLDIYTDPSVGTVLVATFRPRDRSGTDRGAGPDAPGWAYGAVVRPYPGETVSGDGYALRADGPVLSAMLCDGLGHGPLAERATVEALRAFLSASFADAPRMLEEVHESIGSTRGAAAAVLQTAGGGSVRFAGIGNIAATVDDGEGAHVLPSLPGVVGHGARRFAGFDREAPIGSLVVLHSDGLTSKWQLGRIPGIRGHSPLVVSAGLLRVAGTRSDDASALVIRTR
jgi:anti-sigma regulatory factor (Ser/Thr protein kinase)